MFAGHEPRHPSAAHRRTVRAVTGILFVAGRQQGAVHDGEREQQGLGKGQAGETALLVLTTNTLVHRCSLVNPAYLPQRYPVLAIQQEVSRESISVPGYC